MTELRKQEFPTLSSPLKDISLYDITFLSFALRKHERMILAYNVKLLEQMEFALKFKK